MNVAILGFGTVGRGVYEMIQACDGLTCTKVLERPGVCNESFIVNDINDIVSDKNIDAVVECIGGTGIANEFARKVLSADKHFVTSNKALVSAYGLELRDIAAKTGAGFLFSAACGGTMPILLNLGIARRSDEIKRAGGILNGTVNFMLTRMQDDGWDYDKALKEAQRLGYAEADPSADVGGLDTLRKVILLSAVGFDVFPEGKLYCEGIESTTADVIKELKARGLVLRLLGSCGRDGEGNFYAFVQPVAFRSDAAEANIRMNLNMAFWEGKNCGKVSISGQGAGRYPTAANVLRDLTEVASGRRTMLEKACAPGEVKVEKCLFRYIVIKDSETIVTDPISVCEMHEKAEEYRKSGAKMFFAALDE